MTNRKRRVFQHIMEDESYQIIKQNLPKEWVIREFNRPDYGIDVVIELFEKVEDKIFETLGEFIFVQVKSVQNIKVKKKQVYPVGNVAKGEWVENHSEFMEIDIIKFVIDTNSIYTIHTLGASVAVLLFLVDLEHKKLYFICLNDYIDKIIIPKNPNYLEQSSVTIEIPTQNEFTNTDISTNAMQYYGKRAKLLSSFSKFHYQKNEIANLLDYKFYPIITYRDTLPKDIVTESDFRKQISYFLNQIDGLDIWKFTSWEALVMTKSSLIEIANDLKNPNTEFKLLKEKVIILWHQLGNLGSIYEDICREWFLPKYLSLLTSYPEIPPIIKSK